MKKEEKLSAELREKVAEVRLDNEGKPENQKVTRKEVAAEVKKDKPRLQQSRPGITTDGYTTRNIPAGSDSTPVSAV